MNVHLSIDDVIYSLMSLVEEKPKSVFDIPLFKVLKKFHEKYGIKLSLYAFENYAESFFINEVSSVYWEELIAADFLRIGYHGTFTQTDIEVFSSKCDNFYSSIPKELWTGILRLHKYCAIEEQISILKSYGLTELLCREQESRERKFFPPSYVLNEEEEELLREKCYRKNGIIFRATNIRIEFHDIPKLKQRIEEEMNKNIIVIYSHEKEVIKKPQLLEAVLTTLSKKEIGYVF